MANMQAAVTEHACVPARCGTKLRDLRTEAGLLEHRLSWTKVAACSNYALSAAARSFLQLQGTQRMLQAVVCEV